MAYSISIVSRELEGKPGSPVHREIVFDAGGDQKLYLNGLSINRENGNELTFSLLDRNDTLRAYVTAETPITDEVLLSQEIFSTENEAEFSEKVVRALEQAAFMNSQDLDYIPFNIAGPSQNSNSIVESIVKAMGLEIPAESRSLWAPGEEFTIMPPGPLSPLSQEGAWQNIHSLSIPEQDHMRDYVARIFESLTIENIQKQILADGQTAYVSLNHEKGNAKVLESDQLYDPENAKDMLVPYKQPQIATEDNLEGLQQQENAEKVATGSQRLSF